MSFDLLKCPGCLFVCRSYAVVVRCLVPEKELRDFKNLLINCALLLLKTYSGIPYGITQISMNKDEILEEVALDVGIALVNFVLRCVILSTKWLPLGISESVPAVLSRQIPIEQGNSFRERRRFSASIFRTHLQQHLTVV